MSSGYDLSRAQYEAALLDPNEAARRAHHPSLPLNWSGIDTAQPDPLPPVMQHTPVVYPTYHLGYQPGARHVRLPGNLADPTPAADQFLHTSSHTYDMFTTADLPPLLFRIEPMTDFHAGINVPHLINADTGLPVVNYQGKALRYFSFLPRYIGTDITGALLEFWFRLDYRLESNDIKDRMLPAANNRQPMLNTLNMRKTRWRDNCSALAWKDCRIWPVRGDLLRMGKLSMLQICFNTTMLVDLANQRFLKPVFSDAGCGHVIGYVDAGVSFGFFLRNAITTVPTRRMFGILTLRWRLQELAAHPSRDLGDQPDSWTLLPADDEPIWWNDRTAGGNQRVENDFTGIFQLGQDNCTHSEYMENEVGTDMEIGVGRPQQNRATRGR